MSLEELLAICDVSQEGQGGPPPPPPPSEPWRPSRIPVEELLALSEEQLVARFSGDADAVPVLAAAVSDSLESLKACVCSGALRAWQAARAQNSFYLELVREAVPRDVPSFGIHRCCAACRQEELSEPGCHDFPAGGSWDVAEYFSSAAIMDLYGDPAETARALAVILSCTNDSLQDCLLARLWRVRRRTLGLNSPVLVRRFGRCRVSSRLRQRPRLWCRCLGSRPVELWSGSLIPTWRRRLFVPVAVCALQDF